MIEISKPTFDEEVENEVLAVIRSGQIAQGPKVEQLESLLSAITGCSHVVAVTSGTVALELALALLDLKPGDEILTSPFTFGATLNAIIHAGATATFVDVDQDGLMNVDLIDERITGRTRALIPVHLYGLPVDLGHFKTDASIFIVEDAAQALGAEVNGKSVGGLGLGCFSFYATKNVTTGEGGAITTNDRVLAENARILRNQGMRARYEYVVPGHNLRMTDLQAALGIPQLKRLTAINHARTRNATRLMTELSGIPGLKVPAPRAHRTHAWHQFTVKVTAEARLTRDDLQSQLAAQGIRSGIYYPKALTDYPCFSEHPQVRVTDVPNSRLLASEVLSLPVHHGLHDADIDRIVKEVRDALGA